MVTVTGLEAFPVVDGIAHEIGQRLPQPSRVPMTVRVAFVSDDQISIFVDAAQLIGNRFAQCGQIGLGLRDRDFGTEDRAGEIEQVIQNSGRPIGSFNKLGHDFCLLGGIAAPDRSIHRAAIDVALKGFRRSCPRIPRNRFRELLMVLV
jgi:hypothetical protein